MNSSNYNLEKPENLLTYMTPGVYQILCVPTNTIYIGITQNILERFGKHSARLAINRHDCAALQEDWNRLGQDNFTFTTICSGPEWANRKDRELKEKSVIKQKIEESYNVYNIDLKSSFTWNYKRSISIDGKIYPTIEEATRSPDVTAAGTVIRRRLKDPEWPTYMEVEYTYFQYSIDGKLFNSYKEIIAAGLANTDGTIRRRLRSKNFPNWVKIS